MPAKKPKRIIVKRSGSKGIASSPKKLRRALAGTFAEQARRDDIVRSATKGKQGLLLCDGCGAVYYDKHWHTPTLLSGVDVSSAVAARCEECKVVAGTPSREAEGEVVLDGLMDPAEAAEVLALVRNVGARAMRRDPEERIIRIAGTDGVIHVFTTENQLAVSIGKQVHQARKGGELTITWSSGDKPVLVRWRKHPSP